MKKQLYVFSIILAATLFTSVNAKAATTQSGGLGGLLGGIFGGLFPPTQPTKPTAPGTNLPINSNVVFLTIAGIAVGIGAIKKSKATVSVVKG